MDNLKVSLYETLAQAIISELGKLIIYGLNESDNIRISRAPILGLCTWLLTGLETDTEHFITFKLIGVIPCQMSLQVNCDFLFELSILHISFYLRDFTFADSSCYDIFVI